MKILYSTLLLVTFLQVGYAQDPVITFSETEIYCNGTDTLFVNVANAADIKGVYNYTQSMNPCFSDEISGTIEITEFDEFTENEYSVSDFSFGAWGACYFIDPPTGNLRWTLDGSLITWPGTDNYGEQWQFDSFESTGDSYTFTYSNTYAETGFVTLSKVDGSTLPFLTIDPSENTNNEYTYNWSTGSTDNFIVISENGTYSVTISDGVNNYEREYELMNAEQEHPDFNALSDLYNSTNGIVWDNREGWENAIENNIGCNPCKGWIGVTCLDNRVIEIDLTENNLTGVLTPAIQELNALTELNLSFNLIGGEIPKELGNLENLTRLTLTGNQLTGTIPPELSSLENLNNLSLSTNLLTGEIPEEFGNLNLFSLGLGNNRLTGSIPNSLANINGLRLLTLGPNLLTGEFPNEIIENKFLFFLSVWGNQLEGPLPTGLIDVGLIDLRYNNFSGTIPEEYGVYSSIFGLRLDGNQLEGEIPNSIYASAGLSELSLRDNNLSGELSSSLNNFEDLDELYLDGNNFEGCAMDLDSLCNLVYNPNDTLVTYNNSATYNFKLGEGYDLTNNPKLPWSGDFQNYCNGESPIGASCDDGDSTTSNDVILDDCTCGMLSSNFDLGDRTVSIYPNPASDFIRIETSNPEGLIISLIDITGKKLNNLKLNATNEISNLESGIYIIQVLDTSGNILINDKLFIE